MCDACLLSILRAPPHLLTAPHPHLPGIHRATNIDRTSIETPMPCATCRSSPNSSGEEHGVVLLLHWLAFPCPNYPGIRCRLSSCGWCRSPPESDSSCLGRLASWTRGVRFGWTVNEISASILGRNSTQTNTK